MGNGSICTKVEQFDESVQMPSISPPGGLSTPSSTQSYITPEIKPPPPPPMLPSHDDGFRVEKNTDQYSSIWDYDAKLSSTFQQPLKAEFNKAEHHQKETMNTKWSKTSSTNLDSTRVESMLNTQTHSCINLSTSEKIDDLIKNLNRIHTQLDDSIKRRTQQISTETESILAHIINETQQEQQRLLYYAKEQQTKQDEHYRDLLQKYISQLDEIRAKELIQLQEELQNGREQIMKVSQMKIMTVNEQANMIKSKIVKEEQQQASMKIDAVNVQLQSLSTDETFQQLGSEIITKTNVITNANVGTKAVGQSCSFEFIQDVSIEDSHIDERSRQGYRKISYSDIRNERRLNQEEVVTKTGKKVVINPKIQVNQSR